MIVAQSGPAVPRPINSHNEDSPLLDIPVAASCPPLARGM